MLKRFHSVVDITPPYTSALQNILGLSPRGTKYTCHFPRREIKVKTTEAKMDVFCLAWLMGLLKGQYRRSGGFQEASETC